MIAALSHQPVLVREVMAALNPRAGAIYVDGTFGDGGYSRALLDAADCTVWGIDRDPEAVARGSALAADYAGRLNILHGRFGEMADLLRAQGVTAVDGVVLDLGVSSMQLDDPARGFSFRFEGPLDMRMDPDAGRPASEVVNGLEEARLARIIYVFGEERRARRIARAIVEARKAGPITSTKQLADIVRGVSSSLSPRKSGGRVIDPATRTFQALRIFVNDELGELDRGLSAAEALLSPGGRLAVVSFHSLEDRRVKSFLRTRSGEPARASRHMPERKLGKAPPPSFRLLSRRVVRPTEAEIAANPRARSARLRTAERTAAPARPAPEPGEAL
ncbi:MAG: 16S rRNA (cytosine(1402)-N(4))-methyltransferase RsmH [Alphaproteobacteria bacterium]|nr:16S rRNA (cytosine(1402)-N(4))-methyltransferase RsmH [Alphaproteobacteria bacterium]